MSSVKHFGPGVSGEDVFVGIDQSISGFGLTFLAPDLTYDTWVFSSSKELRLIERLMEIEDWLVSKLTMVHVCEIAIESPVRASQAALISGQLFAVVLRTLLREVPGLKPLHPMQVSPMELKKYVTGKGTGVQKNQMLLQTYKHFNVEFTDDNAADSYGLARIASGSSDTQYQRDVLEKLRKKPTLRG